MCIIWRQNSNNFTFNTSDSPDSFRFSRQRQRRRPPKKERGEGELTKKSFSPHSSDRLRVERGRGKKIHYKSLAHTCCWEGREIRQDFLIWETRNRKIKSPQSEARWDDEKTFLSPNKFSIVVALVRGAFVIAAPRELERTFQNCCLSRKSVRYL